MADGTMIVDTLIVLSCLNQQNRLELGLRYLLRGQFCVNDYHTEEWSASEGKTLTNIQLWNTYLRAGQIQLSILT